MYPLLLDSGYTSLAELNIALITLISNKLHITCDIRRSSTLQSSGVRTQRLLAMLTELGATHYLSPEGAKAYLTEDGFSQQNAITLSYQQFNARYYHQTKSTHFIEKLSIVDVVANMGWQNAEQYIK